MKKILLLFIFCLIPVICYPQSQTRPPHSVSITVVQGGVVLTTGTSGAVKTHYGGTLVAWVLSGSPSGSVTVDVLRSANGAGLPTTSIVGSGTKPSLSSAVENRSTSFSGWTSNTIAVDDNIAINISGITALTYLTFTLYFQ